MAEKHHPDWKQAAGQAFTAPFGRVAAPCVLVLIVVGFFWKLVLTNQFTWLAGNDICTMVMPWWQFQASEWHAGHIPLWDPYSFAGQPLLAQAQPGTANPVNWLVFLSPFKHTWVRQAVLHWYYVLVRIIAALMFYWFGRDLGRSRAASVFGAAVYAIAGYLGTADWPQMTTAVVWIPAVFLFQFRVERGVNPARSAILSGFFFGLMWLSGHHQIPVFVGVAWCLLWLWFIYHKGTLWKNATIALALAGLTSALQVLPAAEYGRLVVRWAGGDHPLTWNETVPYAVHQQYSLPPLSILSFALPGIDRNVNPFIGVVALALAITGLWAAWSDRRIRCLATVGACGLAFALGPNSVVHGLFYSLAPFVEKARVPGAALVLTHLAVCTAIAFGIDHFPALPRGPARSIALSLAAFGGLLSAAGAVLFYAHVIPVDGDTRFMITDGAALGAAAMLWAWWKGAIEGRVSRAVLLGLALIEIGNVSGYFLPKYSEPQRVAHLTMMSQDSDVVEYLRKQPGRPFRIEYDGEAIPHNIGDWWGIDTFTSYVASAPENVMSNDPYSPRVQEMLGVRYYFGVKPLHPEQEEVFTGASGRKLFRNPTAFPRAWAVHQAIQAAGGETRRTLVDPAVNLATTAVLTRPAPKLEACSGDSVRVTERDPNRVALDADMTCRGIVVLSETYFPGWRASIDGRQAEILETNGFVRGVIVDGGKHRIEMVYRPLSVQFGGAMTLAGTLIALGAGFRLRIPLASRSSNKL
jgi:hypothetical protein